MSFNPEAELRTLAEADARRGGRKLAFRLQCAAFAALYEGVAPKVVGFAFKISPQTVSYISGCLDNDPDPYRREKVEAATDPARPHRVEVVQRVLQRTIRNDSAQSEPLSPLRKRRPRIRGPRQRGVPAPLYDPRDYRSVGSCAETVGDEQSSPFQSSRHAPRRRWRSRL